MRTTTSASTGPLATSATRAARVPASRAPTMDEQTKNQKTMAVAAVQTLTREKEPPHSIVETC